MVYEDIIAARRIDCPHCKSTKTFAKPETAWIRFCNDCDEEWDIRSEKELEFEDFYPYPD